MTSKTSIMAGILRISAILLFFSWLPLVLCSPTGSRLPSAVPEATADEEYRKLHDHALGRTIWGQGDNSTIKAPMSDTLVMYTYTESPEARENLEYFIAKGLNTRADFIFVFNGETNAHKLLPGSKNIRIVQRPEDTCSELGAMGLLLRDREHLIQKYQKFITMNASIRGPFVPTYAQNTCWMDNYLNRVNKHTKLVGMTIDCSPNLHVQPMLWATDKVGMGLLNNATLRPSQVRYDGEIMEVPGPVGYSVCNAKWAGVGATDVILQAGYGIDSLSASYHQDSYRHPEEYCKATEGQKDGGNVSVYDTMFLKTDSDVDSEGLKTLTEQHLGAQWNSWHSCSRPLP